MKKTIKAALLALACMVCVFLLLSCTDNDADSSANNDKNNIGAVDKDVIYSPNIKATLVLGEGVSSRSASLIRSAYHEAVGQELEACAPEAAASAHEIIVGKAERDISVKAYRALELVEHRSGEVGYVIYSDGKSVALAFDGAAFGENVALTCAVEDFVRMYMTADTLKLDAGVVYYANFDPIEKQAEMDEEALLLLWDLKLSQITEKLGGDKEAAEVIVDELKTLYNIYNNGYSTVKWIADLYDPETGGFYYSNSARNNIGYLPDLESTSQALSIIELMLSGYGGTLTDYFGEEIAGKFVSFAKNMQDQNGYFYHPQWKRELVDKNSERKTRDVFNALSVLDFFGAKPTYDTPNGVKGEGVAASAAKLTVPLKSSRAIAVSRLVSAESDEIFIPNHLKTKESFESYLSGLDIRANTESVSEVLYAEIPLYLAIDEILEQDGADYRLIDILTNYLYNKQSDGTGLWASSSGNKGAEIAEISSVIKIYNAIGAPVARYRALFDTIVSAIGALDKPEQITEITSLWMSLYSVVNNVVAYSDESEMYYVTRYLERVYSDFDVLIRKTMSCVVLFGKSDGSFSTTEKSSVSEILGMPVALPEAEEGDISATLQSIKNLWLSIFGVLEVGSVPVFTASDRMMFQKTFLDLGIVIKNEIKEIEPLDFENYGVGEIPNIRHEFGSGDSRIEIVEDPLREGNSARLYSSKAKGARWDFFYFDKMSSVKNASCYSYEVDMCVLPETSSGVFAQLYLYQDVHLISLSRSGDTVHFYENSSRTSTVSRTMDVGVTAQIGEWFNLRVEYYPAPHGSVRIKIYFNDRCVVVSDNYYSCEAASPVPPTNFSNFCIYGYLEQTMDVLVDNVSVETSYRTYTVETGALNRNVDYPEKSAQIHDFEKNDQGEIPSAFVPSGSAADLGVRTDVDGNKVLALSENMGEIILPLDSRGAGINSALVEFDFALSGNSESGATYQISFNEYKYDNSVFGSMFIVVNEENGIPYATIADGVSGAVGDSYRSVKFFAGEKHRISFHLFFNESVIVTCVDGTVVGINTNVSSVYRYYLGEIKLISKTPSLDSEILIDNVVVEKVAASFDEVTAPDIDRAVIGFDTTDGMEISGVSTSGGVLSFENAAANAYLKVPVNVRSSAPTMGIIGLDVSASGSGSLNISLTDKAGNIIASFVIASLGGRISIYEQTENGRYPTAIYTLTKSDFNLSIEYSEQKGNFNILIDGEYATATAITYSENSTAYDFEYLTVSCAGKAGIAIDNLYAELICGIFKSHPILTPNLDPVNGVITYETSSFASMPSKIERILGDITASHSIKEAKIKDGVSKVLEMNCGTGKSSTYSIFSKTQSASGSNAVFFESYLMLKATTTVLDVKIELMSSSSMAHEIAITGNGADQPLRILGKDLEVKEGEWFHIRIEYRDAEHDFDYDGLNDVVLRVYINGEILEEKHTPYNVNNVVPSSSVSKARVRNTSGRAGIIYFDDSIFGNCNMSYTAPHPADTDTITYEPGVITNKTQASFGKTTSKLSISKITVSDKVTRVLDFYTSQGSYDKLTVIPTLTEGDVNAVMFETDVMINPASDAATLYLDPLTPAGNQPIRLTIVAAKDGSVTLYSNNSVGTADPVIPDGLVIGKSGEWLKLKIEYMNPRVDYTGDKVDDILCRIYVNGEIVKALYQPYKSGGFYAPALISRYVLSATAEADAHIYLDNTRFWLTNLEADEAPEQLPDIILGEGEAENGFDTDAWV